MQAEITIPSSIDSTFHYLGVSLYATRESTTAVGNYVDYTNLQLEVGTATSYEPYYNYEVAKIDTAQDTIIKDNGSWYLHKEVGKEVFDGSNDESWIYVLSNNKSIHYISITSKTTNKYGLISNYYNYAGTSFVWQTIQNNQMADESGNSVVFIRNDNITSVADFKTWLSTHNTEIFYVLATPTNTEITETTLINQLEAIRRAQSYNGITNISQTNEDLPFILDLEALKGE